MKIQIGILALGFTLVSCGQDMLVRTPQGGNGGNGGNGDVIGGDPTPTNKPDPEEPTKPINVGAMPEDYMTLSELKEKLQEYEKAAPNIAEYKVYGNVHGRDVFYLRLNNKKITGKKPSVLIAAAVHGDEKIATTTVMGVLHKLLENYDSDAKVKQLVDSRDVYIVPVTCPDGYDNDVREVDGGIDPNRSYPWPNDPNADSAECVKPIRELYEQVKFNATIDYHASGRMWLLPWGYTQSVFSEGNRGNLYRQLGKKLANLNGYIWGAIPDMVGYIAPGSSADYFYLRGKQIGVNTCSMGVEVGTSKHPSSSSIAPEINKNWEPMLLFIKEAPVLFDETSYGTYASKEFNPELVIELPVYESISKYFTPGLE